MSFASTGAHGDAAARLRALLARNDVFVILACLTALATLVSPAFLSLGNLSNLLTQSALLGILSIGQFMVVVSGGFDLSVAAVMALSSVVLARYASIGLAPMAIVALAVGAACGLFNGLVVAKGRVQPLIATLAMMGIARGVAFSVSEKSILVNDPMLRALRDMDGFLSVPTLVWVVVVTGAVVWFRTTRQALHVFAVGGNEQTARLAGVATERIKISVYTVSGMLSGLAGIVLVIRSSSGVPLGGVGWELELDRVNRDRRDESLRWGRSAAPRHGGRDRISDDRQRHEPRRARSFLSEHRTRRGHHPRCRRQHPATAQRRPACNRWPQMSVDIQQARLEGAAQRRRFLRDNGILVVFLAFVVFATLASGGRFIQPENISVILFQGSVIGVLALGQTLVMLIAGIDLSIVTVAILAAIVMGAGGSERQQMMNMSGILPYLGFLPAILVAFLGAAAIGFVNGLAVVKLRIPAFIVTLAMSLALSGLAMLATGGAPVHYPDPFFDEFGHAKILGLPLPVYVFLALALGLAAFLARSAIGMMLYAIGGNPRAALLSGIPVERISILVYTLSGFLGGVAGFLFLARTGSVAPTSGGDLLLNTIAAVVIGGVSLYGGKGTIANAAVGTLLLAGLGNLMNILHISPYLQDAVSGLIIIAAIMVNVRLYRE